MLENNFRRARAASDPRSLRRVASMIREAASRMAHRRSREIGEGIARDLEKKAARLERIELLLSEDHEGTDG